MKQLITLIVFPILFWASEFCLFSKNTFWRVNDGTFVRGSGNVPEYFVGANFWYGPILGSEGIGGDRARLLKELDSLESLGVTNLRVLVGGDGPDGVLTKISPTLQKKPGVYDENILKGLDFLLCEMSKRGMSAVLYLNNAWEWSGGYTQYLEWAGAGKAVIPAIDGWPAYMTFASKFVTNDKAKTLFANHIKSIVSRVNSITGKAYKDDPVIFSWQICNEPRCFSSSDSVQTVFADWLCSCATLIKSIDGNHMVSTGSEGSWGCENSMELYEKIHSCPDIDYLTIHIWPYNWSWVKDSTLRKDLTQAIRKTDDYIDAHLAVARKYSKPVVLEEFGFPRDGFSFSKTSATTCRDEYYGNILSRLVESKKKRGLFAGINFWGWGGEASQSSPDIYWSEGDAYCGDPAQEPQGLNSVYVSDKSTLDVIRKAASDLNSICPVRASVLLENDWMYYGKASIRVATDDRYGVKGKLCMHLTDDKAVSVFSKSIKISSGIDTVSFRFKLSPGFYRAYFHIETADGKEYPINNTITGSFFNIGCRPGEIVSPQDKQPDFDEFWSDNLAELASVSPDYMLELLPERSDSIRRTYIVHMKSLGGVTISGIYIEPVKAGRYPAFITYMGYGSDPWYEDPDSNPNSISFQLSVRDQGLCKAAGTENDWVARGLGSRDTYYYKFAFADVVRAVDFVASGNKTDTTKIFAEGGSQGGAFTLIAASLDHRIRAIAPFVPFLSDFPDYFRMAEWPANQVLPKAESLGLSDADLYRILSYFDVKNFTDRINCPVLMGFGLQDTVCPPHAVFSGYNLISSPKQYICFPMSGHHVEREAGWWKAVNEFFGQYTE